MISIDSSAPGELHVQFTPRYQILSGVLFLLAAFCQLVVAIDVHEKTGLILNRGLFPGVCFFLASLTILFHRFNIHVDNATHTLSTWHGTLGLGFKTKFDVSSSTRVTLKKKSTGKFKFFAVNVTPNSGSLKQLSQRNPFSDYCQARQVAEAIAKCLNISLYDHVGSGGENREPQTLDWSFAERCSKKEGTPKFPELSKVSKLKHAVEGHARRIVLPAKGMFIDNMSQSLSFRLALCILFPLGLLGLHVLHTKGCRPPEPGYYLKLVISITVAVGAIRVLFMMWSLAKEHLECVVSRDVLIIEDHGIFFTNRKSYDCSKIEDIFVQEEHSKVIVRIHGKLISIGDGLDESDLYWIKDCIVHILCS